MQHNYWAAQFLNTVAKYQDTNMNTSLMDISLNESESLNESVLDNLSHEESGICATVSLL